MDVKPDISNYRNWPLNEKFGFFDSGDHNHIMESLEEKELHLFLESIIIDGDENSNIRKKALENFTDAVLFQKLKIRHALALLIDNWTETEDIFLQVRRLKDIFLFYEEEPEEIEAIYDGLSNHTEAEIQSECNYNLGLIYLFQSFTEDQKREECLELLQESRTYFQRAVVGSENRIDADFFRTVSSILIDILQELHGALLDNISRISQLLFQQQIFSFDGNLPPIQLGFYRTVYSLSKIKIENPSGWLDYRSKFKQLCFYFYEIKNQEIKNRLSQSKLLNGFSRQLINESIEPYFAMSFNAEVSKIEKRLSEVEIPSREHEFLLYLKDIATSKKKRAQKEIIRERLINTFPFRNTKYIDDELERVVDIGSSIELLSVYEALSAFSFEHFLDSLISSCIDLQGHKIYRTASEDDRNTFIASSLDKLGYFTKDQTRWGKSYEGKMSGEIDIMVKEKDGKPYSIIEAMNLDSLNKAYINKHLLKIFGYDTSGLKQNFILVYSTAKKFQQLWENYINYIKTYEYPHELLGGDENEDFNLSELRIWKSIHKRHGKKNHLYHVFLNMES